MQGMFASFMSYKDLKNLRMRKRVWIDDFIEENDMIFVVLMFAIEKREKRKNKRIKINGV